MTCAHIAACKGSVAVIKELMKFNKAVVTSARNKMNNSSALHLAAEGGHAAVVRVLVDAGASVADENGVSGILMHMYTCIVLCMHTLCQKLLLFQ